MNYYKKYMRIIGKPTIHPVLFFTGKIAGYITWIFLLLSITRIVEIGHNSIIFTEYLSYSLFALGLLLSIISTINLGRSTTLGLPTEKTNFKKGGLYKVSRNPMYLGFDLLTLASIIFHMNVIIALMGTYSIFIYHTIILGEEKYLERQFGKEYMEYKARIRRYL